MFVPNKGRPDTWHLTPLQAYGTRQPWHSHMSPQSSTQSSSLRTSHVYLLSATLCVMMLLFDRSPRDSEEGCDLLGGEKTCECEKERKLCLFLWFLLPCTLCAPTRKPVKLVWCITQSTASVVMVVMAEAGMHTFWGWGDKPCMCMVHNHGTVWGNYKFCVCLSTTFWCRWRNVTNFAITIYYDSFVIICENNGLFYASPCYYYGCSFLQCNLSILLNK